MSHAQRKWPLLLGAIGVLLATGILAREPILLSVGHFLIVKDDLQSADLIHVLGGDVDRIDYGTTLYKQGYARKIFFTGGRIEIPLVTTTYSRLAQEYALVRGVHAADLIQHESRATSTYEEAQELKELLNRDTSIHSIIIVSSPYHLRRARWTFTKVLDNRVAFQFAPVPFEVGRHNRRWWTDEKSLKTVIIEYLTIPFYYVQY